MEASVHQELQFCTEEDYEWSFIEKLPLRQAYFGGALKCYDSDASTIVHLGVNYKPFWSLHVTNDKCDRTEQHLFASRADGLPGLALFANNEPQSQLTALYTAMILLMYTRQCKSRSVLRLERSQSCRDGSPPSARFIREMLRLVPLSGAIGFAVFPGRDHTAVMIARLVTYVASFMMSMNFSQFQSESEFESWMRLKRSNFALADLQEFDLFSEQSDHLKYFCSQFDNLRKEWPEDANMLAGLLGSAYGSLLAKTASTSMRETHGDSSNRVALDHGTTMSKVLNESAKFGFESLALIPNGQNKKLVVRRIELDSIQEDDEY